jgi:hypothetical protein
VWRAPRDDQTSEAGMEPGVRIIKITEEHIWDENGNPETNIRVTFMVTTNGPFSELFSKDEYDTYKAEAKIDEFARGIKRLTP